ncbi:hypothetical protein CEY12_21280 [Chryseobacterium sp. T16E-39]|uniref:fibronectin type III domain-containing protein n=1 Tax=Chryseobacterium sp. T16E-39 TaxID=2015076 RepID=UPI000B5B4234|nr:fibronectin type III domain-containing protein [Chryseobacterium sp. T16E-39]ASK32459.1 hypothetical protein CEY12_21280 [Chryseobacterium sp. T16E-39]
MKKLLLTSLISLGIGVSAQTNIAGYSFNKTTGVTYTPITGGTKVFPSGSNTTYDDEVSSAITLTSPFTFGGVAVNTVYISSNGFITFGAAPSTTSYTPLSTLGSTVGAISAFGQDGGFSSSDTTQPPGNHEVRYQDFGTEFVVQWQDHANYDNRATERLNFQIHLNYATGAINIVYGDCTDPGTVSTTKVPQVGIRGNSTSYSTNVSPLMIGNVPAGTTCDWSKAVTGNSNSSNMLFSGSTNVNVKIPSGLQYTWTPGTQLPVRTFAATTAITNSGATINWTAPTGATAYNVQYRDSGSCDWTNFSGNPVSGTTASITGLTQNTTYQVQVQALNGTTQATYSHIPNLAGTGNGYVTAGSFITLANCTSTVTGLTSSALTPDTGTINWTASTTPPTNGYEYYYSTSSTAPTNATTPSGVTAAAVVTANLSGLLPGTQYYYWVRANCNGTDKGVWSSSANFTTLSLCPTVTSPGTAEGGVSTTPTITWTAVNGATGYTLKVGTTSGASDVANVTLGGAVTSYTLTTTLANSTTYYYSLSANTSTTAGPVTPCSERTFTTACPATNVPYVLDFENVPASSLPGCSSAINVGTGNIWTTEAGYAPFNSSGKVLRYKWNSSSAANTWFFTQGINLTAGSSYTISYKYANSGTTYAEKLKVAYGTSSNVAGMTNVLADYPNINDGVIHSESLTFTPTTTGVYYFGFQAYSIADRFYLMVDDINIDLTSNLATSEVKDIKNNIKVYPNPFSSDLNISDISKVKSVSVSDVAGRLVKTITNPTSVLQLGELKSGMYMVTLEMKDGSKQTIKTIKK